MIKTVFRLNPKTILIFLFVALGPLGNILTPFFFPKSFRIYYFLLPFFPFFFLIGKERIAKIGVIFFPLLIYCFFSSYLVEKIGVANEEHTLFRFFLLFCQFFFILGAASSLKRKDQIPNLLKVYFYSFFTTVLIGYVFFFGFYLKIIPLKLIERFTILTQFGFGILRFSPGSYPNEYGVVSSFALSTLLLTYLEKKQALLKLSNRLFHFFFMATFGAFLLTTTRAAYLSFFVSSIYIIYKSKNFLRISFKLVVFIMSIFLLLIPLGFNMFSVLTTGFTQKINEGSLGERFEMWEKAVDRLEGNGLLGVGFGSITNIHSVYIQLLFELGFVGSVLLFGSLLVMTVETFLRYKRPKNDESFPFFHKIKMVGLINVLSFAASNHNLNHHLTWFTFFLSLALIRYSHLEEANKSERLESYV